MGALDFISKPFKSEEVLSRVKTHLKLCKLTEELKEHNTQLSKELNIIKHFHEEANRQVSGPLLGNSPAVQSLKNEIKEAAEKAKPTLLIGKPGCGANSVAREIHNLSIKKSEAFIYFNCATITQSSGVNDEAIDKFELAKGGTLYLDLITQLSLEAQKELADYIEQNLLTDNELNTLLICH